MSSSILSVARPVSAGGIARVSLLLAALALQTGATLADSLGSDTANVTQPGGEASEEIDRFTTRSIGRSGDTPRASISDYIDPSANRYGDGAPYAVR